MIIYLILPPLNVPFLVGFISMVKPNIVPCIVFICNISPLYSWLRLMMNIIYDCRIPIHISTHQLSTPTSVHVLTKYH